MRVSMRFAVIIAVAAMGMSTLSLGTANTVGAQSPKRFVIVGAGGSLPADFEALVNAAGGALVHEMDRIGVAVVESAEPGFLYAAESIHGVLGVAEDHTVALDESLDSLTVIAESLDAEAAGGATPAAAKFWPIQWNMKRIGVERAWAAGQKGDASVKVAVIDTGIDYTHQDLAGKVDMTLSQSYFSEPLPPERMLPPGMPLMPFLDVTRHGTMIAGIIAAEGKSVAGIAPRVTLIALKVAGRAGFAEFGTIIKAIYDAADKGADVINLSFGDQLEKRGRENAQLMAALNRAVNYAHARGALLVASAGNKGINWDRMGNIMKVPAQLPHVVAVSATGPYMGKELNQFDEPLLGVELHDGVYDQYTDYGQSIITFAAPGGSKTGYRGWMNTPADWVASACARFTPGCSSGAAVVFDVGTSFAAAHVSGIAALVDSAHGGTLTGDQILNILMRTAHDYGKSGKDELYGFGLITAAGAVTGK